MKGYDFLLCKIIEEYISHHHIGKQEDFRIKSRIVQYQNNDMRLPFYYHIDHFCTLDNSRSGFYHKQKGYASFEEAKDDLFFHLSLFHKDVKVKLNDSY